MTASRQMGKNPMSFGSMFWENQFKTTIPLPPVGKSLDGKVAVITGANSGLGFECAKQLLKAGLSRLVIGVRSLKRGEEAATKLRAFKRDAVIQTWEIDMEDYSSVQAFARRCDAELTRMDFVILNAGLATTSFAKSQIGHDMVIQVNYLGTTLLAILLLPVMKKKGSAAPDHTPRLTVVSSATSRNVKFPNRDMRPLLPSFDDTEKTPYAAADRYAVSKLLGQMTFERIAQDYVDPKDVMITLVEPGWVRGTGLSRGLPFVVKLILGLVQRICARSVDQGAATYYDAVVNQGAKEHGSYIMNQKVAPYADIMYTDEGKQIADVLWDETMLELDSYGPLGVLESIRKAQA